MKPGTPRQNTLRKGRCSEEGRAYFITKCTVWGRCLTADAAIACCLIDALFWMDEKDRIALGSFVVMPDHYHAVLALRGARSLESVMQGLGSYTAKKMNLISGHTGPVWQEGFFDRGVRRTESISAVFDYVHFNPVRKGYVAQAEQWPFSSLNAKYKDRMRCERFL